MSTAIRAVTAALLCLPPTLAALMVWVPSAGPAAGIAALLLSAVYLVVWLLARPTAFVITDDALEIRWPLRRRRLARATIRAARVVDAAWLRASLGAHVRVGAGGLWGGFGWLYARRCGRVPMYVSRADGLVWLETTDGPPWLLGPDTPAAFVAALGVPPGPD